MRAVLPLDADEATRAWLTVACFMAAVALVLVPPALVDARTLDGVGVWVKPLKFAASLVLHFLTLAVLVQFLSPERRAAPRMKRLVQASVAAGLFEIGYLAWQATRGRHSHFNFDTGFETVMYALMGAGATLLVAVPFVVGVQILRQRDDDGSGLRLGAVLGLLLAPALTMIVSGYMSGVVYGRWIGEAADGGAVLPLLGWSREAGDLRPAHFVALHAMQLLPLAGYAGDRFVPAASRALVWATAALLAAAAAALFAQALAGRPVWPL